MRIGGSPPPLLLHEEAQNGSDCTKNSFSMPGQGEAALSYVQHNDGMKYPG
jgi:hypothetical protein